MCNHDHKRQGRRLQDGAAHTADHEEWSRRKFLSTLGLAAAGGTLLHGSNPIRALGHGSFLRSLADSNSNRILVLVQLEGGNDGLNTVVPYRNDDYHRARPRLGLQANSVIPLSDEAGLHPQMSQMARRYGEGQVAVIQGVGYDAPDLSHFRSTDIWVSGSDSDTYDRTGWGGRTLETLRPELVQSLPERPVAVQLGGAAMMFRGRDASLGMRLEGVEALDLLESGGPQYPPTEVPATVYGGEMQFLRSVANSSFRYAEAIQQAASAGGNRVAYQENELGEQLAAVASLIRGGLGSRIYHVSLAGFDTHSFQAETHGYLLESLSRSIDEFYLDLESDGLQKDVLVMTFSEFGRTIVENGSEGTDHATSAPHFLVGPAVAGGLFGAAPDLTRLNDNGDMAHSVDFRSVYGSVLEQWFGMASQVPVLARDFPTLPLFGSSTVTESTGPTLPAEGIDSVYPNPMRLAATMNITLQQGDQIEVTLYDVAGRNRRRIYRGRLEAGQHAIPIRADGLPAGTYMLALKGRHVRASRAISVVR